MSEYRYFHFDRFRGAKQMAQGAVAQALTEEEALAKAKSWFSPWDSFKLTKITESDANTESAPVSSKSASAEIGEKQS